MKATPLELALQQLSGLGGAVMDKNLQRLAAKRGAPPAAESPDAETDEGGEQQPSEEEMARLLKQYAGC